MSSNSQHSVKIIGHRGSARPYPENSLEAIIYGVLSGAEMIETDLRLSKDEEVVLCHDENLSRLTGKKLNISDMTWEEISDIPLKSKGSLLGLARLKDVFKIISLDVQFYLELKASKSSRCTGWDKKLADKVISIIKKEKRKKQCLLMSFNPALVRYLKKEHSSYKSGLILGSRAELNVLLKNKKINMDCLAINYKLLTKRNLKILQESGTDFIAWTVNSKRLWNKIASYDPVGIVTDYPEKFGTIK